MSMIDINTLPLVLGLIMFPILAVISEVLVGYPHYQFSGLLSSGVAGFISCTRSGICVYCGR